MRLFDSIQNILQNVTGHTGDVTNHLKDNLPVDEISNLTDQASNATEELTNKINDAKDSIGS